MKKWLPITLSIPVLLYLLFSGDETESDSREAVEKSVVDRDSSIEKERTPLIKPKSESEKRLVQDLESRYGNGSKQVEQSKKRVEKEDRYRELQRKRAFKLSQKRRLYEYKQRVEERKRVQKERQRFIAFKQERKRFVNGSRPLQNRHRQLFIEEKRKELIRNQFFEKRRESYEATK